MMFRQAMGAGDDKKGGEGGGASNFNPT